MLYADPTKLEANQLSPMDVVRAVNDSNVILPAGDVQIGRYDYNIYTNSMLKGADDIATVPLKTVGQSPVRVGDVATAQDSFGLQYNVVRVNGQRGVYLPIFKARQRFQHDRYCGWRKGKTQKAVGRAVVAKEHGGFRPIAIREDGYRDPAARGWRGFVSYLPDDFDISRKSERNYCCFLLDSAFAAGDVLCVEAYRQFDQQHGVGRIGTCAVAPDRQLGGRAGKHFSAS